MGITLLYLKLNKHKGSSNEHFGGNFRINFNWIEELILGDDLHELCFQRRLGVFIVVDVSFRVFL